MNNDLLFDVLQRVTADYELKPRGGDWLRNGRCPACGKKELYTNGKNPWILKCGRESKCGDQWHVKDLYPDLFEDWSKRAPATQENPKATASAYLEFNRGFNLNLIKDWFSQESYFDRDINEGSATVRFPLQKGGWWERIIDRPHRFDKKARFKFGESFRGVWWQPPTLNLDITAEIWIVEGIFDAIALTHHGIDAVSAMSCNVFPQESLNELLKSRAGDLPTLIWALDNEDGKKKASGARAYATRWARQAEKMGFECSAALLPRNSGKDWNDYHQRWAFIDDVVERETTIERDIDEARYEGKLLLAKSAEEKGLLMYERRPRADFYFGFNSRLYWFKFDIKKYGYAMDKIEESDERGQMTDEQVRNAALRESGAVSEIANCYPEFLYYQRNDITDEAWYYARVDFPHDGGSQKGTFTGGQVAAAAEFKKRLIHMAPGAVFTGTGAQLDRIAKDQLFNIKQVDTIDFVGYSKEYGSYVFGDVAVRGGVVSTVNAEDYFEFGRMRLKTLQKSIQVHVQRDPVEYNDQWINNLWLTFGTQGLIALAFWFGSLFCEQIREQHKSFPFLEVTGEAGAGKTTLLTFLWKLLGREHEGFDPSKASRAGRRRVMGQVSGMPVVMIEADRNEPDRAHAKGFDFDELKDFFGGGTLGTTGQRTGGNETYEPPFRGTICISQNADVSGSEAIMTRIVKLHFKRPNVTTESRIAADNINQLDVENLSHFLLKSVRMESQVLAMFNDRVKLYEIELRKIKDLRIERIVKNHSQMLAMLDCLKLVVDIPEQYLKESRRELMTMALERQRSISADHPAVAEFWEVYEYLQMQGEDSCVNHSADPKIIAININEFYERASMHRQNLVDIKTLRMLLRDSRSHKLMDINKPVHSSLRATAAQRNLNYDKPITVKCWTFKNN